MTTESNNGIRLDKIDQQTIYWLMTDARGVSAPEIADGLNVSAGTIRNRINQLEKNGIIRGYSADIDFQRAGNRLTNLYICTVPVAERESLAHEIRSIPGVINVRELMSGKRNLHIKAIGEGVESLQRIAHAISEMGIDIEEEHLIRSESDLPYVPFGPDGKQQPHEPTDFISLAGNTNVIEVTVSENAPVTGKSIQEAVSDGVLEDEILIISVERGDQVLTPRGKTVFHPDDIVTLLSRGINTDDALGTFKNESEETNSTSAV
ncbi:Lrp/AsnC family transcriptional regulator [Natranaeroarchaeum aerophilus]|uniref:Winged helix-turn-helix transcriptional regulator n=1 Tax=Natranaeroarchaeum aerophilus TaxID=2917711 RepID=A0AAE3K6R3_9EURY|nr:TrkA C-terminal domain-containing protein [Natranaeroarchaeum aerophilus]MCL9815201.1 winged helix-turn-helix transcriptional regulator [Natranaeroarchaeum aerophilus]